MKKFVLFFILSLLLISFGAFLLNAFNLQKDYFNSKNNEKQQDESEMVNDIEQIESYYVGYTKEDYEKALAEKRVLVLYFTSNWCEECKAQDLINNEVFNDLTLQGIVGLKIHILDSETTTETDALAKKYDVTKESSYVLLNKDGSVAYKYVGSIDKELLKSKIIEATVR